LCYVVGYLNGTNGEHFFHLNEQKVLVSTNTRYLEDEQSTSTKGLSRMDLMEKFSSESTSSDPIVEQEEAQPKDPM
jgi:hypothetical protein